MSFNKIKINEEILQWDDIDMLRQLYTEGKKTSLPLDRESYEVIKLESILSKYKETLSKNPELQNFGDNIYM